jgi:hypothetical protein
VLKFFGKQIPGLKEKTSHFFKKLWADSDYKNKQSQLRQYYWDSMTEVEKRKNTITFINPKLMKKKKHCGDGILKNSTTWIHENKFKKYRRKNVKNAVIAYKEGKLYGPYESITECDKSLFDKTQNPNITDCLKGIEFMFRVICSEKYHQMIIWKTRKKKYTIQ